MNGNNTYTEKDFLIMLKLQIQIKNILKNGIIEEINKDILENYGIIPNKDGFYKISQSLKFIDAIKKRNGKNCIDKFENYDFEAAKKIEATSNFVKRFLLLTLSKKFEVEIDEMRKRYRIPKTGFQDIKTYKRWIKKMQSLAKKEIKDKSGIDYLDEHRKTGVILLTDKNNYLHNPFTSLFKLSEESFRLLEKRCKIRDPFLSWDYIIWGFKKGSPVIKILNAHTVDAPPSTPTKWTNPNKEILWGMDKHRYAIYIPRKMEEKELLEYIKENYKNKIKPEMEIFYASVPLSEDPIRDFLIFKYYKLKKTNAYIKTICKIKYNYELNIDQIKTIIKRLNKRIDSLEKG